MDFTYFDPEHAIRVHDDIIEHTGGIKGILNLGLLKSSLQHIQNDECYPYIHNKLTHLFFSIIKNHCFNDGNKRSAIALAAYFLEINDCSFITEKFMVEMENIVVDVADNRINKDLLLDIITSIVYDIEYSAELKIKILHAKNSNQNY